MVRRAVAMTMRSWIRAARIVAGWSRVRATVAVVAAVSVAMSGWVRS